MNRVHIPGNDFTPTADSRITKVDIMSPVPKNIAYSLEIKGNKNVEAGKHYMIKQISSTEAVIEEVTNE